MDMASIFGEFGAVVDGVMAGVSFSAMVAPETSCKVPFMTAAREPPR